MIVLHTSDWHLGQKFLNNDRKEEHQLAFEWLEKTITEYKVDVLIVSGDIFDIGNPPSYARTLYYQFLTKLQFTCCRHIVVIGGNHDSPSMLNAPKELLEMLNVYVVGAVSENLEDEILLLKNEAQQLELIVAAVPFLRDRDIRQSIAGETGPERMVKVQEGIVRHFNEIGDLVKKHSKKNIPVIATGHLYAKGALASDKQDNIYIGNIENIEAKRFPKAFDYVALGHIHRAQMVSEQRHIRYSGSIIPLSFSEIQDSKSVEVLHFEGKKLAHIETIKVPRFRELVTFTGDLESVKDRLQRFDEKRKGLLKPWVDIMIEMDELIPNLDGEIRDFAKDFWMDILKIRTKKAINALDNTSQEMDLDELSPEEVFLKRCEDGGHVTSVLQKELVMTFRELLDWMREVEEMY